MAGPSREQYQAGMGVTFMYSLLFHVVIVIIAIVGLPHIKTREYIAPQPISIEIAMIDDVIKTTKPPKEIKKPEPKKDKKPIKTPPKADQLPTPKKADKQPKEIKKIEKHVEKKPPPPKEFILKKPKIKKPKEVKKPEPKKEDKSFNELMSAVLKNQAVLKNLSPEEEQSDPENTQQGQVAETWTTSELSAVSEQIGGCWNLLPGARDADLLTVELRIKSFPDRTVKSVDITDKFRYQNDPFFRAAADNAVRAIRNPACSPLNLPPNKYDLWKDMIFNFDPRGMF
ncbi:MAG: hypothetical protein JKY11_00015 [Alphaproteobacteria bacterium]|nr:hypothetical protein [Alphaproteobacteria bacterium]